MMILKMRSVRYMKFLSLPRYKNLYPFVFIGLPLYEEYIKKNLLKNRIRSILNKRIILMRLCVEREIYNEYLILFKTKKRSGLCSRLWHFKTGS